MTMTKITTACRTGLATRLPELSLMFATFLWGFTFLGTSVVMGMAGPMLFVGTRFAIAALVLALLFRRSLRDVGRSELMAMVAVGLPMSVGYILQAAGLETIESSKSAFITALHVPIVPLLQWLFMRTTPHRMTWVGVGFCLGGLTLLSGNGMGPSLGFDRGEWLTILSAASIALEIVMVGVFAPRVNVKAVSILQLAFVACAAFMAAKVTGEPIPDHLPPLFWQITIVMALATAVIQLLMNWAQRTVSPTRATLIYTTEPVWAGMVGWTAGERLGPAALLGCGLIFMGVLLSEWRPGDQAGGDTETG